MAHPQSPPCCPARPNTAALRGRAQKSPKAATAGGKAVVSGEDLSQVSTEFPFGVQIGPHRLRMLLVPRAYLPRRKLSRLCLETGVLLLDNSLSGRDLADEFAHAAIAGQHYCHGVTERDITEETFTHSASSGFITFAQANPVAIAWWLGELDQGGKRGFLHAMFGRGKVPSAPKRVLVKNHGVKIEELRQEQAVKGNRYGEYEYKCEAIRLLAALKGPTLATILLHELMHAMHHLGGIALSTNWRVYCRNQPRLLVEFALQNPSAWRYLLWHAFGHERAAAR